jgi:Flp pilus assembly protein TadG
VRNGQALVETALVLPLLLFLGIGVVGVARITQARLAVDAVAREAARAGAMAASPSDAASAALGRGLAIADADHLDRQNLHLAVDVGQFRPGGTVQAEARYDVSLADLPFFRGLVVPLAGAHQEFVDPYRSRVSGGAGP